MNNHVKLVVLAALAGILYTFPSQAQEAGVYQQIYLTPKAGMNQSLKAALAAHNEKYHGEGPHQAFVQEVLVGERSGDFVWLMGPTNFAAFDSRPADDGHNEDWALTVMPHVGNISKPFYTRRDNDRSYSPEDNSAPMLRIRMFKLNPGVMNAFNEHLDLLVKVYTQKKLNRSISVHRNNFASQNDFDVAIVWGTDNWAQFDGPSSWVADYESVHGEGSWQKWIDGWVKLSKWVDQEVRVNVN